MRRLKQNLAEAYIWFLVKWYGWFPLKSSDQSVLILPPSDLGSIGDDAILTGYLTGLGQEKRCVWMISYGRDFLKYYSDYVGEVLDLKDYFSANSLRPLFSFIKKLGKTSSFVFLAADVLDGYYSGEKTLKRLRLVELAARMGVKSGVINFSFNSSPDPEVVNFLKKMHPSVYMIARDAVSRERAEKLLQRDVHLSCDAAFLLKPQAGSLGGSEALQWLEEERTKGLDIVGVNINWQSFSYVTGASVDSLVRLYKESLVRFLSNNPNTAVIFLPHDSRGENSDFVLTREIMNLMGKDFSERMRCIPDNLRSFEVKHLCSFISLCFTGRLHLAIACLGQGKPVAAINYQDKAEGVFDFFDSRTLVLDPAMLLKRGDFSSNLEDLLRKKDLYSETIRRHLPDVQTSVKGSYQFI